jgi:hypothetical protein
MEDNNLYSRGKIYFARQIILLLLMYFFLFDPSMSFLLMTCF